MQVEPYLFFNGSCEDAANFYVKTLGAEITFSMQFKDAPEPPPADFLSEGWESKIMHMNLTVGDTQVMMSDGCHQDVQEKFKGFSLTLTLEDDGEAKRLFEALSEGGEIKMPFGPTFFASAYGMLTDQFGVGWIVIVPRPMG